MCTCVLSSPSNFLPQNRITLSTTHLLLSMVSSTSLLASKRILLMLFIVGEELTPLGLVSVARRAHIALRWVLSSRGWVKESSSLSLSLSLSLSFSLSLVP